MLKQSILVARHINTFVLTYHDITWETQFGFEGLTGLLLQMSWFKFKVRLRAPFRVPAEGYFAGSLRGSVKGSLSCADKSARQKSYNWIMTKSRVEGFSKQGGLNDGLSVRSLHNDTGAMDCIIGTGAVSGTYTTA